MTYFTFPLIFFLFHLEQKSCRHPSFFRTKERSLSIDPVCIKSILPELRDIIVDVLANKLPSSLKRNLFLGQLTLARKLVETSRVATPLKNICTIWPTNISLKKKFNTETNDKENMARAEIFRTAANSSQYLKQLFENIEGLLTHGFILFLRKYCYTFKGGCVCVCK